MRSPRPSFPMRVLLLGRSSGLPIVVTPNALSVTPSGAITFRASYGAGGATGPTLSPATPSVAPGSSLTFGGSS